MLLAARQWVPGVLALVVGVPVVGISARALHGLTQRWVVLVPAGLVLKDHVTLADPVLFKRDEIERLLPAPASALDAGHETLDLTARSPGLALELRLKEPAELTLTAPGRQKGPPMGATRLVFTPTRPGAVLVNAATNRIPTA